MALSTNHLLLKISSNTNQFVDLKCKAFKKLIVTNSDSEAITINLVVGKDDNAGETSITNGAFILEGVTIPVGVSMSLEDMNFSQLVTRSTIAGALSETDYTVLIAAGATNKVFTIYLEY